MRSACSKGAHKLLPVSAQAIARGAARCASQVLGRGAASLVVRRRYLIVVPRAKPASPLALRRSYLIVVPRLLPAASQEKNNWAEVRKSRVNITGFTYTVAR